MFDGLKSSFEHGFRSSICEIQKFRQTELAEPPLTPNRYFLRDSFVTLVSFEDLFPLASDAT